MELLNSLDRKAVAMQQGLDGRQDLNVMRAVKPASARPLHRPDEGKSSFPEPQDMLWHAKLIGGFRDRAKGVRAFGHGSSLG